ncbi:regulator of gene activity-like [Teleopsis dalmanni]|uniref:regulator of gene activity-like n=1 Tax=Teleopsis dalmanni TaxID=139649 RepID=UPI0018CFA9B6|nr:regulator of gene activity-like [Teleopsis dalmanni]
MKPQNVPRKNKQERKNKDTNPRQQGDFPTLGESFGQPYGQLYGRNDQRKNIDAGSSVRDDKPSAADLNYDLPEIIKELKTCQITEDTEKVACTSDNFWTMSFPTEQELDDDAITYKKKRIKRPQICLDSISTQTNFDTQVDGSVFHPTITIDKEGNISNIPPNVITDGFGIVGLQSMLERRKRSPELTYLQLGVDVNQLDIDLMSDSLIYPNFGGALNPIIKTKDKAPFNGTRRQNSEMTEEMLLYIFYSCASFSKQMEAAVELYEREWRFHKMSSVWMQMGPDEIYEHDGPRIAGIFKVFEKEEWGCFLKYSVINVNDLCERPQLNAFENQ